MRDTADNPPPPSPGARQVARLIAPVFAASILVMLIGVVIALTHHRTLGLVVVVIGAIGGFAVRARLVLRSQQQTQRRP